MASTSVGVRALSNPTSYEAEPHPTVKREPVPCPGGVGATKATRESGAVAFEMNTFHWTVALFGAQYATAVYADPSPGEDFKDTGDVIEFDLLERGTLLPEKDDYSGVADVYAELVKAHKDGNVKFSKFYTIKKHESGRQCDFQFMILGYKDGDIYHVVVALRGTKGWDDMKTDAMGWKDGYYTFAEGEKQRWAHIDGLEDFHWHAGFSSQYTLNADFLAKQVCECINAGGNGKHDMLIAGHSMGGALARLTAFDLLARGIAMQGSTRLVTIGAGPVGNEPFAEALDRLLGVGEDATRNLHMVNNNDPIPAAAVTRSKGGSCGCTGLCASHNGAFVHGGSLVWFDQLGQLQRLSKFGPISGGCVRRWNRLVAWSSVINGNPVPAKLPLLDHASGQYTKACARLAKRMGVDVLQGSSVQVEASPKPEQDEDRSAKSRLAGFFCSCLRGGHHGPPSNEGDKERDFSEMEFVPPPDLEKPPAPVPSIVESIVAPAPVPVDHPPQLESHAESI